MDRFKKIKSIVTPFDKVNVDTDQIVPKQFLKLIQKTGFGKFLFYNWRFNSDEKPNSSFILNDPKYKILKIQTEIEVDLENQIIKTDTEIIPFQIDEYKKKNLLNGLDEIALTLKYQDKILEYEKKSTISSLL